MSTWFVKLSLVEELGESGSMGHNLNMTYEAEDAMDAINQAITQAFKEAHESGHTLSSIHVGTPRQEQG